MTEFKYRGVVKRHHTRLITLSPRFESWPRNISKSRPPSLGGFDLLLCCRGREVNCFTSRKDSEGEAMLKIASGDF